MTSSNTLKYVVSCGGSMPRTSLNLNFSLKNRGRLSAKSLMCDMLYSTSPLRDTTTSKSGGGQYDYKSISTFQSNKLSVGCKDSIQMDKDFKVKTLEGNHYTGKEGDYLIQGVKGEVYPCRKDIFEETYTKDLTEELTKEELEEGLR